MQGSAGPTTVGVIINTDTMRHRMAEGEKA